MRIFGKQIIFWTTPLFLLGCIRESAVPHAMMTDSVFVEMSYTDSLVMMTDTVLKYYEEKKEKELCKMDSLEKQLRIMKTEQSAMELSSEKVTVTKKVFVDTVVYEFDSTFKK